MHFAPDLVLHGISRVPTHSLHSTKDLQILNLKPQVFVLISYKHYLEDIGMKYITLRYHTGKIVDCFILHDASR